ncbi:MAG: hypothetical protein IJ215_00430 [Clostridia bacterium]|nr:hypothetical protein [Clostridia bacterium]
MNIKKLKVIFILLLILLIVFIAFARFNAASKIKEQLSDIPNDEFDVSTDVTADVTVVNQPLTRRIINDYTNPTIEDKATVYERYGMRYMLF